jgi:hypothetical protein
LDSGRLLLKLLLSTCPILFGISKTVLSSSFPKCSYKIIKENNKDNNSTYKLPTIKYRKHILAFLYIQFLIVPLFPILSEVTISKDQDIVEEVNLQSNTKASSKTSIQLSWKPRPLQKIIENILVE